MKPNRKLRSIFVGFLLIGAVSVALAAIGCFGGGEDSSPTTEPAGTSAGVGVTLGAAETTQVAAVDPLSSFKSKDPFIPQAQATTTLVATTSSVAPTTSRSTTTTVRVSPPTTVPHRIKVTQFPGGGIVNFTLDDGVTMTGFGVSPALFNGPWGSIQIIAVNDTATPQTATFRRIGYSPDIILPLDGYRTW